MLSQNGRNKLPKDPGEFPTGMVAFTERVSIEIRETSLMAQKRPIGTGGARELAVAQRQPAPADVSWIKRKIPYARKKERGNANPDYRDHQSCGAGNCSNGFFEEGGITVHAARCGFCRRPGGGSDSGRPAEGDVYTGERARGKARSANRYPERIVQDPDAPERLPNGHHPLRAGPVHKSVRSGNRRISARADGDSICQEPDLCDFGGAAGPG